MNTIEREFLRQRRRREAEEVNQGEILPIGYTTMQIEEGRRKTQLEESFQRIIEIGNFNNDQIITMSVGRYVYFRIKYFINSRQQAFNLNENYMLKFNVRYRAFNNWEPREINFYNIDYSNYVEDMLATDIVYYMFCGINENDKIIIKNYFREKFRIENEEQYYMTRQEISKIRKAKFFSSVELEYFNLQRNVLFQEWVLDYWNMFYNEDDINERLAEYRRIRQFADLSNIYNMTKYIRWLFVFRWFYIIDVIRINPDIETVEVNYVYLHNNEYYLENNNFVWDIDNLQRMLINELETEEFLRRRQAEMAIHAGLDIEEILRMLEAEEEAQGGNGEHVIYQGFGWQEDENLSFESTYNSDHDDFF